jgi:hypothetical protein
MNPPKAVVLALVFVLAGCAASKQEAAPASDAGGGVNGCAVTLLSDPGPVIAGPTTKIRVSSVVTGALGVFSYDWQVLLGGVAIAVTYVQADNSAIEFLALVPGAYEVSLTVTGGPSPCSTAQPINVGAPGARSEQLRLRITPLPGDAAPPHEERRTIQGGADVDLGVIGVDPGVLSNVMVSGPAGGVPAYLRFSPSGAPDAVVEAFANAMGLVATTLLPEPHTVLIVPSVAGLAPRRIASWSSPALVVDAGAPVSGFVQGPGGGPLVGATVQLSIDGVPSTVSTLTPADGSFTVRAVTDGVVKGTSAVLVEVTPPSASGLPRLLATSTMFDLTVSLQVRYDAGLALKDLAGTHVTRNTAPVAGANVMVVGSLATAGTVTAGTTASAAGEVRIATSAGASGVLPTRLVPSAALSAVVTVSAGDLAVVALDTTAAVPANLDAPPMTSITATMQGPAAASLPGAVLDLVPAGALAMAAVPTLHLIAGPTGKLTATLASGGHYDLRFHDPVGRAAPLPLLVDQVAATITGVTYHLPAALQIRGKLMLGGTRTLPGASIQILCDDACTGIDRSRPIAESVSDVAGQFTVAVPDPGTL